MDNNLFQEAKQKIANLRNTNDKDKDQKAIQNVFDSVAKDANPEQRQQLEELRQQLYENDVLS